MRTPGGDEAARNYAELAMSMIAHGRYGWAGDFIEESQRVGRARETAVALEVLTHLLTSDNEPSVRIEPPIPGPEMDRTTARQLTEGFDAVRAPAPTPLEPSLPPGPERSVCVCEGRGGAFHATEEGKCGKQTTVQLAAG